MWWKEPVTSLKGIGAKKAADLERLGISSVGDLLNFYPRQDAYSDYSKLNTIDALAADGTKQVFKGTVYRVRDSFRQGRGRQNFTVVTVRDATGYIDLYFFGAQRYGARKLKPDETLLIIGRVTRGRTSKIASVVSYDLWDDADAGKTPGIQPVYALTEGITQKNMASFMRQALSLAEGGLPESLPEDVIKKCALLERLTALKNIHFPESWEMLKKARERFIFEELFLLQCGLLYYSLKRQEVRQGVKHGPDGEKTARLLKNLPFSLTPEQKGAWQEISLDMQNIKPMHRILQGDVGSGKTVISALALAKAAENGYQGCLMAPTEILAMQHYETMKEYLEPLGLKTAVLTGGLKAGERKEILAGLAEGTIDVAIGTHALLEEDVKFDALSLAITDEQHRFGVDQRARLANKSSFAPDVLVMTATPIPRTLALTVYGDLDISVMKGRPPGRKPVQTLLYTEEKRDEVYKGLLRQVNAGSQAYVVCPLIEASDVMNARSAETVYAELKNGVLKGVPCALLHGRLKGQEKDEIMAGFAAGEIKVLVATTVIEVGVNVPNAALMVIENAERFGLAQIHQLRGRVGRGEKQSFCVLLTPGDSPESTERLKVLRTCDDGFRLAEEDLKLRGAGQLFGLRQHGLPDLHMADILRDTDVIVKARRLAQETMRNEGDYGRIRKFLDMQFDDRFQMIFNS